MILDRKMLLDTLSAIAPFVNPRSPHEASKCVRIEASDGMAVFSATSVNGSATVEMPCDGNIECTLELRTFRAAVGLQDAGEVSLTPRANRVRLEAGPSKVDLSDNVVAWNRPHIGETICEISLSSEDALRCTANASLINDTIGVRYANAVRIVVEDGRLYFISTDGRGWCGAWCRGDGGEQFDTQVLTPALVAAKNCLKRGDRLSLQSTSHATVVSGDDYQLVLPKPASGEPPRLMSQVAAIWKDSRKWIVSRDELIRFLKQAGVFVTPEAKGIWLDPVEGGLMGRYTGRSDGSHSVDLSVDAHCEYFVPGEACEGPPAYVSQGGLAPVVYASPEEDFELRVTASGVVVIGKCFVMGIAQLVPPAESK